MALSFSGWSQASCSLLFPPTTLRLISTSYKLNGKAWERYQASHLILYGSQNVRQFPPTGLTRQCDIAKPLFCGNTLSTFVQRVVLLGLYCTCCFNRCRCHMLEGGFNSLPWSAVMMTKPSHRSEGKHRLYTDVPPHLRVKLTTFWLTPPRNVGRPRGGGTSREAKVVFFVSCGVERRKSIYKSTKIFYH